MMSDRRARYKNTGLDANELRRRREEDSVQLRKQKRDDVLSKRRTINQKEDFSDDENSFSENDTITPELVAALMQDGDDKCLIANAQRIRRILSLEPEPPFDTVIQAGLIPRFIELLGRHDNTLIQFEVAWILTNISSGNTEQTRAVVDCGAVPVLVNLCHSEELKVSEQCIWALGNIIGDGPEFRDLVIAHGFVPALLSLIRPDFDIAFLRNETWVLVNLCRSKDPPTSIEVVKQLVPALNFLITAKDSAVLTDTVWAICYITELGIQYSQIIIDNGLVAKLIPLLTHKEVKIQTAALRSLGSIVTGPDDQTQAVIDAGVLPSLIHLLKEGSPRTIKEALWFISNITAGSKDQVQAVIDSQVLPIIIYHLENGDWSQQKEAAWTIYNMTLSGTPKQLITLVEEGAHKPLTTFLHCKDQLVVRNVMEAFHYICSACSQLNKKLLSRIEECGALDSIEKLQASPDPDISNLAYGISDSFFSCEN